MRQANTSAQIMKLSQRRIHNAIVIISKAQKIPRAQQRKYLYCQKTLLKQTRIETYRMIQMSEVKRYISVRLAGNIERIILTVSERHKHRYIIYAMRSALVNGHNTTAHHQNYIAKQCLLCFLSTKFSIIKFDNFYEHKVIGFRLYSFNYLRFIKLNCSRQVVRLF